MHLLVAPEAVARGFRVGLLACALLAGCARQPGAAERITATWAIEPTHPSAGEETTALVTLRDDQRQPVRGAHLRLEAQMLHPGMAPVITNMTEQPDGVYSARWLFSMGGDWALVATGRLADGSRIRRERQIGGVQGAR